MAAQVLQDGKEELAPYMKNSTPEEQAALLVTYFKQGFDKMKTNYDKRMSTQNEASDMLPGEGARMFNNIETIQTLFDNDKRDILFEAIGKRNH